MSELLEGRTAGVQTDARGLLARRAFASLAMGTDVRTAWAGDGPEDPPGSAWVPADAGRPVLGVVAGTRGPIALGFGERAALREFLERLAGDGGVVARLGEIAPAVVFVPRGDGRPTMAPAFAEVVGLEHGRDWDWMVTEDLLLGTTDADVVGPAPRGRPTAGAELFDVADPATRRAVAECLDAAIPDTHALTDLDAHRWFGVRETPGDTSSPVLAALAADARHGSVYLEGLGVRPDVQGQGIGSRLLRAVVRTGLAETGAVTLGLWADNHGARRLYERLGFRLDTLVENWRAT